MASIAQVKVDPRAGNLILTLQAEKALPIRGVLSTRESGEVVVRETGDPSVVQWILPPIASIYVVYGVILPQQNLWLAPSYVRTLQQGAQLCRGNFQNPRRFSTEKHADGEWVGAPEAFKIIPEG